MGSGAALDSAPVALPSKTTQLIRHLAISGIVLVYRRRLLGRRRLGVALLFVWSVVLSLTLAWLQEVTTHVPDPYLDEVFHVPQAQLYCEGKYYEWDDKITTPPGLYFITVALNRLVGIGCSVYDIRLINVDAIALVGAFSLFSKAYLERKRSISFRTTITAINVALFPVLFFFSGLYYTDPLSTLAVLVAYTTHLRFSKYAESTVFRGLLTVVCGVGTLLLRQTNVFWVVGYLGGLEIINGIKRLKPERAMTPNFHTLEEKVRFYAWRYSLGDIHDPPVSIAYPVDIALCVISIAVAAICNISTVLRSFLPHAIIAAVFAAFVMWNGGVVLGDKSNHVATLHLAQMLYTWPLFAFFSAPLLISRLLDTISTHFQALTPGSRKDEKGGPWTKPKASTPTQSAALKVFNQVGSSHLLHCALLTLAALAVATLIVHFNTIIHPFTLADNRHYMFYVFRYSILNKWWVRYALVPVYISCAWLCWAALQGSGAAVEGSTAEWIQSPVESPEMEVARKMSATTSRGEPASPPTSTVLMLLLTSTLSLMTAPLVEPRYFILPWVMWRLLVPTSGHSSPPKSKPGQIQSLVIKYTVVVVLEFLWFLLINVATMWIFLDKPFYWRSPEGEVLDEGRVQRFMW